jgi:uncharacterized delta-60 repeat protein
MAWGSLGAGYAFAAAGDLDTSFSADGVARTNLTGDSTIRDVAVQTNGRIVVVGNSDISNPDDPVIARYLTIGILDPAFGSSGVSEINSSTETPVNGVAIRPTGQIVTAGQFGAGTMFVAQDVAAGGVDHSFNSPSGSNGSLWNAGAGAGANDLALTASGSAIAAGYAVQDAGDDNFAVLRASQDGTTLTNFGGSDGEDVSAAAGNADDDDSAAAVAIDPADGAIVVAGKVDPTAADGATNDDGDVAVARYTSAGVLDTGFSSDGIRTVNIGGKDSAASVAVQLDGRIVVAGTRGPIGAGTEFDHFVLRLNDTGLLDSGFGGASTGFRVQSEVSAPNTGTALALLPDGRIVVGGETLAGQSDWVLARYTSTGVPDTSFDGDGSQTYSFPGEAASLSSLALQADGKVVIGGNILSTERDFAVGRVLADDPPPPTLTGTNPASPANNNSPRILGSAEALSTVALYANATCTPPTVATGPAAGLLSPGFLVSVPDNSTTTFSATAANTSGTSACSTANVTYSEVTPLPPAPPAGAAPATTPTAPPTVAKKCKKAKKGAVAAKKCKKKK